MVSKLTKGVRSCQADLPLEPTIRVALRATDHAEIRTLDDYLWGDGELNAGRLRRHLVALMTSARIHRFTVRTSSVSGDDVLGREREIQHLQDLLAGSSCHLRAPRRYGKTTLLRTLSKVLHPRSLLLDLGEHGTPAGLAGHLLYEVRRRPEIVDVLREHDRFARLPTAAASSEAWAETIERELREQPDTPFDLITSLLAVLAESGIVLLVDEFSLFLRSLVDRDRRNAEALLDNLAQLRTRELDPLRMVVSGSTGLTAYIQFEGLEAVLADLVPVDVEPLEQAIAAMLAEELLLCGGLLPREEDIGEFLAHVGQPIPYFLHVLAGVLIDRVAPGSVLTRDEIGNAYDRGLMGIDSAEHFKPFRLEDRPYPVHLRGVARNVLTVLAHAPRPVQTAPLKTLAEEAEAVASPEDFVKLLSCLEEDFDLQQEDAGWSMRSKVISDRWRRFHPRSPLGN